MQSFEFVMILVSILIGLGIAELLGMVARILRSEARGGSLHTLWVIGTLLAMVQLFWARWEHQFRPDWSVLELTVFLLPPFLMFLAASLLCPSSPGETHLDSYFLERRRPFFVVLAAFLASASVEVWVLLDGPGAYDAVRAVLLIACVVLALTSDRRVHLWGVIIWIGTVVGFSVSFTFSLSGMGPGG